MTHFQSGNLALFLSGIGVDDQDFGAVRKIETTRSGIEKDIVASKLSAFSGMKLFQPENQVKRKLMLSDDRRAQSRSIIRKALAFAVTREQSTTVRIEK
jgi:hypothetical protein